MEGRQASIDINRAFSCAFCKKVASQSVISQCCEVIMCQSCVPPNLKCPQCQNTSKVRKSHLLLRTYQCIVCQCPFGCRAPIVLLQLSSHMQKCPQATTECPFCKSTPKVRMIPQHLDKDHPQECTRLLNDFQRKGLNQKIQQPQQILLPRIQPFKYGTTGNINVDPRLSIKGRLVCGKPLPQLQLPGQPMLNSTGIFNKNKQNCSDEYGSCDRCMEMDADRFGLPKNYLLNIDGRICFYIAQKRKVACGCSNGNKVCNDQIQCGPCRRTLDLVQRGFYKRCLM